MKLVTVFFTYLGVFVGSVIVGTWVAALAIMPFALIHYAIKFW